MEEASFPPVKYDLMLFIAVRFLKVEFRAYFLRVVNRKSRLCRMECNLWT